MELDDFNIIDNGDGTYTLEPKDPVVDADALRAEYKRLRQAGLAIKEQRDALTAELQTLIARRDEIKALLGIV